jgi:hypothetical protein
MRKIAIFILIISIIFDVGFLSGCTTTVNKSMPENIDEVSAHKEGIDGVKVYFILTDKNGRETAYNGFVSISIESSTETPRLLYNTSLEVKADDFQQMTRSIGTINRVSLIYELPRINYSSFLIHPGSDAVYADVTITFTTPEGRILNGDTGFYL